MAKKKTDEPKVYKEHPSVDQRITDTLRENYMPYAMSVIVSRAIPASSRPTASCCTPCIRWAC